MRLVVQKVSQASVTSILEGHAPQTASITHGLCVLVGFEKTDTQADCIAMAKQLLNLRIFPESDTESRPGRRYAANITDVSQDILLVSQFTLNATLKSGRPSFHRAMGPESAKPLFDEFIKLCREGMKEGVLKHGVFGSMMQVHLVNEGPFTFCLSCTDGKCTTW